ncbi:hypothetical protein EMCRGX_G019836 [Ephydatia muelleri]
MEAGVSTGSAALATEGRKHRANDAGWLCVPLVAETYGAWGNEDVEAFSQLALGLPLLHAGPSQLYLGTSMADSTSIYPTPYTLDHYRSASLPRLPKLLHPVTDFTEVTSRNEDTSQNEQGGQAIRYQNLKEVILCALPARTVTHPRPVVPASD